MHSEIADALKGFRQAAREDATDARLDVLRAELAEIVEGARDADQRLGSAESAEQAVKLGADAVTAWVELDTLAERWRTLHELHRKTLRDSLGDSVEPHQMHRHGLVRCLHRYGWPGFGLDPAQTAPTYPHGFNLRALEQTPAALRWAVRAHDDEEASDTYMWVPSRDDLHSADQANVEPQGAEPELV